MLIFFWLNGSAEPQPSEVCPPLTAWEREAAPASTDWGREAAPATATWANEAPLSTQWHDTVDQTLDTWDSLTDTWDSLTDTWDSLLVQGGDFDPIDTNWQPEAAPATTAWEPGC